MCASLNILTSVSLVELSVMGEVLHSAREVTMEFIFQEGKKNMIKVALWINTNKS